eukprot:GILJ01005325.1.p1 GENE.GILJ01005325.1~~GILJ01005325.1.p1  ORF type:complete len:196 (-),score=29.56 GILJ01005325.1:306-893(-)
MSHVSVDWSNKEFNAAIQMQILKLSDFLNKFDTSMRYRLACINEKLISLERTLDFVEATLKGAGALQQAPLQTKAHSQVHHPSSAPGLGKEILKSGDGRTFAQAGQTVVIHYSGKLLQGGVEFDSTRGHGNDPFEFQVGAGLVIKGWDQAIREMSLGERAIILVPPELAYAEAGCGKIIPPNSTLVFDMELLKIK